jgi:predicted acylesterase/phospholipase RssA
LPRIHIVFGGGATKAILSGIGAVLALNVAGLKDWVTIGACSAGSIPGAVLAADIPPPVYLRHLIDIDIEGLLIARTGWAGRMLAILRKYHFERIRPRLGAYATARMRRFINSLVRRWPKRFWNVASCDHGQVLFTADGVFKYSGNPRVGRLLKDKPPSVGLAVCASCAMPGIMDSVKWSGELLFDGALSGDGEVPIDVIARHFKDDKTQVLAFDIGPEPMKQRPWLRFLWNVFCGGWCESSIDGVHPTEREGLKIVTPVITGFHTLEFSLSPDQKWHAIIAGCVAMAKGVVELGLVEGDAKEKLERIAVTLADMDRNRPKKKGEFSRKVETFLNSHGLF